MKVFVYGSLKRGFHNHGLIRNCKFLGDGRVDGATMYRMGHNSFPCIKLDTDDYIFGEIYEIDSEILYHLDRLEGYTGTKGKHNLYNREVVRVQNLTTTEVCDCYIYEWAKDVLDTWTPITEW